jgi:hypothetical protein
MRSVSLIVILLGVGLSHANGKEAEAANEDVPKPPSNFSPGSLTNPKPSAPQPSTGAGNGAARKPAPAGEGSNKEGKPAGGGSPRGR